MTWAILGVGAFVMIVLVWGIISVALGVLKSSQSTTVTLISYDQRAHQERKEHREQMMGLIDRFLSGDWEAVRLHEGASSTPDGGFFSPQQLKDAQDAADDVLSEVPRPMTDEEDDEEPYVEQVRTGWGSASRAEERADAIDEVANLAEEDDLDSFDADRERRLAQARERGLVS